MEVLSCFKENHTNYTNRVIDKTTIATVLDLLNVLKRILLFLVKISS